MFPQTAHIECVAKITKQNKTVDKFQPEADPPLAEIG
jgi:hypothetical protein